MANYEVILDNDNNIMTIINLDTWACFTNDPSNADYQAYEEEVQGGYVPTYMGGDPTAANYPGPAPAPTPAPAAAPTTPPADSSSGSTTSSTPADTSSTSTTA